MVSTHSFQNFNPITNNTMGFNTMDMYKKAEAVLHLDGFRTAVRCEGLDGVEILITVWSDDLQSSIEVRVHEQQIKYLADAYDRIQEARNS
jgi:hypothetical protein